MSSSQYLPLNNGAQKPKTWLWVLGGAAAILLLLAGANVVQPRPSNVAITKAKVVVSGESTVKGTVVFEQVDPSGPVTVTGYLEGLDPLAERGFHVHQFGDLSGGCVSAGPHFNPFHKTHGPRTADVDRHVGDLGNIKSDRDGVASFSLTDVFLTLNGPNSIIGRAVVVHAGTDDLGQGGNEESIKTGNAGGRAACGVIGLATS